MLIYKIINLINGKVYIGKTERSLDIRINEHVLRSKKGSTYLSRAIIKHDIKNFAVVLLEDNIDCISLCNERERHYIDLYKSNSQANGYNLTKGGDGISGYRFSETSNQKRSERLSGKNSPWFGKHHTEEFKRYLSDINSGANNRMYGKKRPDVSERNSLRRKHISKVKDPTAPHHWTGKKHSEETKKKMAAKATGRRLSVEAIQKIKSANINRRIPVYSENLISGEKNYYSSLHSASDAGYDINCISRCINGKVRSHAGLKWIRAE